MKASLTELEAVAAVARNGGFRAAAKELGMSSSAVSHAVGALEQRLSVRLFNRTTRSVSLSAAGERFVSEVAPAIAAIDGAIERAGDQSGEPSGTLRLNMAPGVARMVLRPIVLEYCRRHPSVQVEVVTESAFVDITGQGFDAGIRFAETIPPDMIAIPLSPTFRSLVVASPEYLSGRRIPAEPDDIAEHRCIAFRLPSGRLYRWEFERESQSVQIDAPGSLVLDASDLVLQAALDGTGLAYLGEWAIAPHISRGSLVTMLEDWSPPYPGLCLYFANRRHMPLKLRALVDLIREVSPLTANLEAI